MIAVCPACHDAIHHGALYISDATIYEWKKSHTPTNLQTAHIYVEPHPQLFLLTGEIKLTSALMPFTVLNFSENNQLGFRVLDSDIMLINLKVRDQKGREVLRVKDNYVRSHRDRDVKIKHVPGRVSIIAPVTKRFIPNWMLDTFLLVEPAYGKSGYIPILDLEVISPGLVRVQGLWAENDCAIIITESNMAYIWSPGRYIVFACDSHPGDCILRYNGPIDMSLFNLEDT